MTYSPKHLFAHTTEYIHVMLGPHMNSFFFRLEIQADVSTHPTHKRNSISSESANFSLDAKSATVSFGDDASTKALAGSLCCRYVIISVLIHNRI